MRHLTKLELRSILTVAKKHSDRDWLMFLICYLHGMRATEVTGGWCKRKTGLVYHEGVNAKDISNGEITVRRLKGSLRTIQPMFTNVDPLFNARPALEKLALEIPTGRFFKISRIQFWRLVHKYGQEAGIAADKAHPHIAKHSIAMHGMHGDNKVGIHVMKQHLGHKNINSTAAYLVVDSETATKAVGAAVGL